MDAAHDRRMARCTATDIAMSTTHLKAHFSALVVLSSVFDQESLDEHLRLAQQNLPGWTFHSSFQFATGKRFLAELDRLSDLKIRTSWALAHVVAKEASSTNNWSGAGKPTGEDVERYQRLAATLAART